MLTTNSTTEAGSRVTPTDQPTPAEIRALRAYLEEGSTRCAAHAIGCAESTVKNHLKHVRSKLGAKTTAQVVFMLHDQLAA
jgi:DNA-binding CsgD family transcriptional regulator